MKLGGTGRNWANDANVPLVYEWTVLQLCLHPLLTCLQYRFGNLVYSRDFYIKVDGIRVAQLGHAFPSHLVISFCSCVFVYVLFEFLFPLSTYLFYC